MFWVISVYFNIRNTIPKSGTFLLGHPVYIYIYIYIYIYFPSYTKITIHTFKCYKGNTIVITYQQDYCRKIEDFIENNNVIIANNDPTKTFQKKVRNAVNECQIVVPKDEGWKYINTFTASYLNTQGINYSCLKSPASTLVDLTFQSRALRSFSLNQLRNLSL